jgi:hypothetical protein
MPKKSRRAAAAYAMKSKSKKVSGRPSPVVQYPSDAEVPGIVSVNEAIHEESIDFSSYRYVVNDLRRMGLLIGVLIITMIVLTIILR